MVVFLVITVFFLLEKILVIEAADLYYVLLHPGVESLYEVLLSREAMLLGKVD